MSSTKRKRLQELLHQTRIKSGESSTKGSATSSGTLLTSSTNSSRRIIPDAVPPNLIKNPNTTKFTNRRNWVTRDINEAKIGGYGTREEVFGGFDTRWQQSRHLVSARDTLKPKTKTIDIHGGTKTVTLDLDNYPIDQGTGKPIVGTYHTDHTRSLSQTKREVDIYFGGDKAKQLSRKQAQDIKNYRPALQTMSAESNILKSNKTMVDYHHHYGWGDAKTPINYKPEVQKHRYKEALLHGAKIVGKEIPNENKNITKANNKPTNVNVKPAKRPTDKYDYSPRGQWRKLKGSDKWEKTPSAPLKVTAVSKKKSVAKVNKKTKVNILQKLFPGIDAPVLKKDKGGDLLSPAVIKAKQKSKTKVKKEETDSESWM